jgi:hypothetical protein
LRISPEVRDAKDYHKFCNAQYSGPLNEVWAKVKSEAVSRLGKIALMTLYPQGLQGNLSLNINSLAANVSYAFPIYMKTPSLPTT